MNKCVFCKIISGEIQSEIITKSNNFTVIRDINPKVKRHMLIISKKHVGSFLELPDSMYKELLETVRDVAKQGKIKDFNLILNEGRVAGRIIDHLHLHILPRSKNDEFKIGV